MVAVLVLGPKPQPLLVLLLWFFGPVLPRASSPAVPHGHFAHPGLSNSGTGYCVFGWFLYNVPRPGFQTPLITTGFVSSSAGSPFTPLAHFAALSTLHCFLHGGEALRALVEAAPFMKVKTRLALGAEVFTEAGFAVIYPAPGAHVDFRSAHSVVSSWTVVKTLPILPHPLPPQEQEEFGLTIYAAIVPGAHRAAFTDGVGSIASSFVSPPALRRRLTVAVLHTVQDDQGKGEESKLHLDGGLYSGSDGYIFQQKKKKRKRHRGKCMELRVLAWHSQSSDASGIRRDGICSLIGIIFRILR